jgi:hypothetical protein
MEAALCMAGGLTDVEERFAAPVLEAANSQFHGRLGLQELLMEAAIANGYQGRTSAAVRNDLRGVLMAACSVPTRMAASGFSTFSVPGIMGDTANRFLLEGFGAVETVWRLISARRSVTDFRTYTSYRLTGNAEYEEVGADGQIKHGTLGEEAFTNRARTYAKMFGITRQDIINDDLSALTSIPRRLGRGAALKLNKVFWAAFMDNATFFTTARLNYIEGATAGVTTESRLNIDGLTRGETTFMTQTDPDGDPLAVSPSILLVPPALSTQASQLMNSTEIRDNTANAVTLTNNPHAGKYRVVVSQYLSSAALTGNSTTAWYLLADPATLATIEVAFLNGREQPFVESADADFNTLGIQMRGYHDFGVGKQDWRAGLKAKGAAAA